MRAMRISIILLALTVAACGAAKKPTAAETEAANRKALLQFAQCMRQHGVDMPDPKFQGGGVTMQVGGKHTSRRTVEAAQKACEKYQKQVKPPAGSRRVGDDKELRKKALANAQCMREHGIDMADPTFGSNGEVRVEMHHVNPNSAKFRRAQEACRSTAPIGAMRTGGPGQ
jgi:hypothetical protein